MKDCWNCKHMRLGHQPGSDHCSITGRVVWMERSRPWWHGLFGNRGCGKAGRLFEAGMPHDPWKHLAHK